MACLRMRNMTRSTRSIVAAAAAIVLLLGEGLATAESGSYDTEVLFESKVRPLLVAVSSRKISS